MGPFNGSLVQPFREFLQTLRPGYPYETLPYTYFAAAYTLVINPQVATVAHPVSCPGGTCTSYVLSGGLEMVAPWVPQAHEDHSLVKVQSVPSVQVDFSGPLEEPPRFNESDCDIFGQSGVAIGIRLCLDQQPSGNGWIRAGMLPAAASCPDFQTHYGQESMSVQKESIMGHVRCRYHDRT